MFKNLNQNLAEVGVFGGSGFYELIDDIKEVSVETPYGAPSDKIALGKIGDKKVAFMPRHGKQHTLPPHKINYRANIWAMKSIGVSRLISPCAAGSLQKHIEPGHFVICDQFVNKTCGRPDTFYDGPITTHVSPADPYCPEMSHIAIQSSKEINIPVHEKGTIVVIQGPRFSTKAESRFYTQMGWEVINMTQYPEAFLAREMELCVTNISLITDYDAGLIGDVDPVSHSEVIKVFTENNQKLKNLLYTMVQKIPAERTSCKCPTVLEHARL